MGAKTLLSRERIIEVATPHFVSRGYNRTSLAVVAGELGVVKGALYYYFPGGKREMLDAALKRNDEEMYSAMAAAADAEPDPRRALVRAVEVKIAVVADLRDRLGLNLEVANEIGAVQGRNEREFAGRERALFEAVLQRGEEAGVFRPIRPRSAIVAAIQAVARTALRVDVFELGSAPDGGPSLLAPVFEVILLGLETRP